MCEFVLIKDEYWTLWWKREGDRYIYRKGGYLYSKSDNEILETVEADSWDQLDWTKSSLVVSEEEAKAGWLERSGKFHGCVPKGHDRYAELILGRKVADLEKEGWCRIYGPPYQYDSFVCLHRLGLSAEQRNWLSRRGYDLGIYA